MEIILQITEKINALPEWFMITCFFFSMWVVTLFLLIRKDFPVKIRTKQRKIYDWILLPWCYLGAFVGLFYLLWGFL